MERITFMKTNEEGKKIKCEVIATYHDDEGNKDFLVYTDNTFDEDNKLKVYYSLYEKVGKDIKLKNIKNLEDEKTGLEIVKEILKELK